MKIKFSNKSKTLSDLDKIVQHATILPQYQFTQSQWQTNSTDILKEFLKLSWSQQSIIVRSASHLEDQQEQSLAGKYTSILDVEGTQKIFHAVDCVIDSFQDNHPEHNIVFFQPMLKKIKISGVLFSKDPSTSGHYIIINYDDHSSKTDTVTKGHTNNLKTFYQSKTIKNNNTIEPWKEKIIKLTEELEGYFNHDSIDLEFAISPQEKVFLLQVRPLIIPIKNAQYTKETHQLTLRQIKNKVASLSKRMPNLPGTETYFGIMPDWNPAEIIGVRPRPLALSLYKNLITDQVWSESRRKYGYKNLKSFPLIISLGGIPYIDLRVSFSSFVPNNCSNELTEKLVDYYLKQLKMSPHLHDKIEFNIVHSCFTFDIDNKLNQLKTNFFTNNEVTNLKESLLDITNNITSHDNGYWRKDLQLLTELKDRQHKIINSNLNEIEKIYWLLTDCKEYGTKPFSGLARAAFIAIQMLKSLVTCNLLTKKDYNDFMASLQTISSQMQYDFNNLDKIQFLKIYGHLRPGTYDIRSKCYDENPNKYFNFLKSNLKQSDKIYSPQFKLSISKLKKIDDALNQHKLNNNVINLFNFFKEVIEGREYAKFLFTKNISESLKLLSNLGNRFDISKENLSFCNIEIIDKLYSSTDKFQETIRSSIQLGQSIYENCTKKISLPPLIFSASEVESFELPYSQPNYITLNKVTAETAKEKSTANFKNKVLMIPSADPGYDWIFTHKISGFITKYGGLNSHMAIRAQELNIPAVIGAGEQLFNTWSSYSLMTIDCENQQITRVS